jgi:signal transduction histidine kinase
MKVHSKDQIEPGLISTFRLIIGIEASLLIVFTLLSWMVFNNRVLSLIYLTNLLGTLFLLVYLSLPGLRKRMGPHYLPISLVLTSLIPMLHNCLYVIFLSFFNLEIEPPSSGGLVIFLLLPLMIIAWQYRFRDVVIFCLSTLVLDLIMFIPMYPYIKTFFVPIVSITILRTALFILIGLIVSRMMSTQRQQRRALSEAYAQLSEHSATGQLLAASQERNRLARELHDTLAHTLSGLAVQLEAIATIYDQDPKEARLMLEQSLSATRSGLAETRRALKDLRAAPLDDMGFKLAIEDLARAAAARCGAQLEINLHGDFEDLKPDTSQALYRIVQEALENTVRHAKPQHIDLEINIQHGQLFLLVKDDGQGFDTLASFDEERFGLRGIQERASALGASLQVSSQPGSGTSLQLELEIPNGADYSD